MVKWTKDEEEIIVQGWSVKEHRDSIAEELGRSKAACATRYRKLIKETPASELTGDAYVEKIQLSESQQVEVETNEAVDSIIAELDSKISALDVINSKDTPEYLSTLTTSKNGNKVVNIILGVIVLGVIGYLLAVLI